MVMNKEAPNAFCAIRPPGHHAESNKAMGFCFFNNIAVGIAHALSQYRLERVALRMRLLDPALVLQRGYAWLTDSGGRAVVSTAQLAPGDAVKARLADGEVDLTVTPGGATGRRPTPPQ